MSFHRFPLAHNKLFRNDGSVDLEALGQHLNREGRLRLEDAFYLVKTAAEVYKKEPNLLRLRDPITGWPLCVHGMYVSPTLGSRVQHKPKQFAGTSMGNSLICCD